MKPEKMSVLAQNCEKLITIGRTVNMQNKLDTFMLTDRLTTDEYTYLTGLLTD